MKSDPPPIGSDRARPVVRTHPDFTAALGAALLLCMVLASRAGARALVDPYPTLQTYILNSVEIDQSSPSVLDPQDANLFLGQDPADATPSVGRPPGGPLPFIDWNDLDTDLGNHQRTDLNDGTGADPTSFSGNECVGSSSVLPTFDCTYFAAANNTQYAYIAVQRAGNDGDAGYYWLFTQAPPELILGQPPCAPSQERLLFNVTQNDILISGHFKVDATPMVRVFQAGTGRPGVTAVQATDFTDATLWTEIPAGASAVAVNLTPTAPGSLGAAGVVATSGGNLDTWIIAEAAIPVSMLSSNPTHASVITRSSTGGGTSPDLKDLAGPVKFNLQPVATVTTTPPGLSITVDGSTLTAPQTFNWTPSSIHTIGTASPQGGGATRQVFANWSDGGAQNHTVIAPAGSTTYAASFTTQYLLTATASPPAAGSVTAVPPAVDGFYDSGAPVQLTAAANAGYQFASWSGDLSGSLNPETVTMSAPRSVTATFSASASAANIPNAGTWPGGVVMPTRELSLFASHLPDACDETLLELNDLCLGGPLPLCFERSYGSLLEREGIDFGHLGTNWLGTYDWKVEVTPTTETIVDNRGERLVFGIVGDVRVPLDHLEEKNTLVIRALDNMHRLHRGRQRKTYEFDGTSGLLQKILDEHGNSLTCSYAGGLLSSVADGLGRVLTFAYGAGDRLISVSDGPRTVSYGYTGNDLTSFTDAAGRTTTYAYAAGPRPGLLASATTPLGTTPVTYAYDGDGRVASWTDALSNTWTFGVGPAGGCIMTTPAAGTWTATHDSELKLLSMTNPLAGTTSWTYDGIGRPASITRPLGDVTTLAYDAASGFPSDIGRADGTHVTFSYASMPIDGFDVFHVTGVSYPDGASVSFTYDATGNIDDVQLPGEHNWFFTHNANGQPLTITNAAGGVTTFTYDPQLRLVSRTDNAGNTTTFTYGGYADFDRIIFCTYPDAAGRGFAYDALGRPLSETDEAGKLWTLGYDLNGRLVSRTDPLGHAVQYAYDAMDRVTAVTDALGQSATYAYDALGRLTSSTDRTGRTTTYAYDALGRLVARSDPGGNARTFTYDANGRLITTSDPMDDEVAYVYDALDRVTRATDPLGNATQYAYDSMGRLTTLAPPLGAPTSYAYDPRGLLTTWSRQTLQVALGRTPIGSVSSVQDPNTKVWPFAYDAQGRLTSRADPLARATTYAYNSRSRISQVVTPVGSGTPAYDLLGAYLDWQWIDGAGSVALSYTRDDARRLTSATGATFGYDAADRLTSCNGITATYDGEMRISSVTYAPGKTVAYAYDTRGLLSQVTDWLGGTTTFAYDAAGRLTGQTRANGTTATFQYDAADRLIGLVEAGPGPAPTPLATITLTRDALGRITGAVRDVPFGSTSTASESTGYAYDDASQVVGFTYDGLGRLQSDGTRTFEWDAAGRLAHYTAGTESPTFTYDAFGRVLTRTDGAVTRQFVWNYATAIPSLSSVNPGPPGISYFVYMPSGVPIYQVDPGGARAYYHYNEAGNTIFLTNQAGEVVTSYAYTPTGETQSLGRTVENPFTYAGALGVMQEGESGLWRYGSALFDARTARCVSCPAAPLSAMGARLAHATWQSDDDPYFEWTSSARPGLPGAIGYHLTDYDATKDEIAVECLGEPPAPWQGATVHDNADVGDPYTYRIDPYKHPAGRRYRRVLLQQGRLLLDSDLNALIDDADRNIGSPIDLVSTNPGPIQSPLGSWSVDARSGSASSKESVGLPGDDWSWLTHVDRQMVSPAELLHVSGFQPYPLFQQGRVVVDLQQGRVVVDWQQGRAVVDQQPGPVRFGRQGVCHGFKGDDCSTLSP